MGSPANSPRRALRVVPAVHCDTAPAPRRVCGAGLAVAPCTDWPRADGRYRSVYYSSGNPRAAGRVQTIMGESCETYGEAVNAERSLSSSPRSLQSNPLRRLWQQSPSTKVTINPLSFLFPLARTPVSSIWHCSFTRMNLAEVGMRQKKSGDRPSVRSSRHLDKCIGVGD